MKTKQKSEVREFIKESLQTDPAFFHMIMVFAGAYMFFAFVFVYMIFKL